jgi:hypothetical protein
MFHSFSVVGGFSVVFVLIISCRINELREYEESEQQDRELQNKGL